MKQYDCHSRGDVRFRWHPREDGLEESVQFVPGFNCSATGPDSHGVAGMGIRWVLRGPAGAVVLGLATDFMPGERRPGHGLSPNGRYETWGMWPMGTGIEYHRRVQEQEGEEGEECGLLEGPCYSAQWFGGADEPVKRFVSDGEQVIWDTLEEAYSTL